MSYIQMVPESYIPLISALIIVILALLFNGIISSLLKGLRQHFLETQQMMQMTMVSALKKPICYFALFTALIIALDLQGSLLQPLPHLPRILSIAALVSFGWFLMRWLSSWVSEMRILHLEQATSWEPPQLRLIEKTGHGFVIIVIGLQVLHLMGINVTILVLAGALVGFAVAFGAREVVANFFGGLMLYFTKPFALGERISLPEHGIEGYVEEVGWCTTKLQSLKKKPLRIPNSLFAKSAITTPSRTTHQCIKMTLTIQHRDLRIISQIIEEITELLKHIPEIDQQEKTSVDLLGFIPPSTAEIRIVTYVHFQHHDEMDAIKKELILHVAALSESHDALPYVKIKSPPENPIEWEIEE